MQRVSATSTATRLCAPTPVVRPYTGRPSAAARRTISQPVRTRSSAAGASVAAAPFARDRNDVCDGQVLPGNLDCWRHGGLDNTGWM